jgi:hypothetical protein
MGTLIKLAIAALIVHGSWRAGTAYWKYYKFRDNLQATAQFAGAGTVPDLHARAMEIASEFDIPVTAEQVNVRQEKNFTFIDAAYTDRIEILPRYFYPWEFKVNVQAFTVKMPTSQDFVPGTGQ